MNLKRSKQIYSVQAVENAINYMVMQFSEKQGLTFVDYADEHLGIANFEGNYWLNVSDILHDLKSQIPKGVIVEWYDLVVDNNGNYCNYKSHTLGKFEKQAK